MAGSITSVQESVLRSDRDGQNHFRPALFELSGFFYEDCVFGEFLIKQIVSSDKDVVQFFC